tara:strand:- start:433 stop:768 length:336 start_codon:yes stop_codon:yes gene_type:complete
VHDSLCPPAFRPPLPLHLTVIATEAEAVEEVGSGTAPAADHDLTNLTERTALPSKGDGLRGSWRLSVTEAPVLQAFQFKLPGSGTVLIRHIRSDRALPRNPVSNNGACLSS